MKKESVKIDLASLRKKWPSSIVAREEIGNFTGGAMTQKYLANLDSQRRGPDEKFRLGRKVVYPVESLLRWLESRMGE